MAKILDWCSQTLIDSQRCWQVNWNRNRQRPSSMRFKHAWLMQRRLMRDCCEEKTLWYSCRRSTRRKCNLSLVYLSQMEVARAVNTRVHRAVNRHPRVLAVNHPWLRPSLRNQLARWQNLRTSCTLSSLWLCSKAPIRVNACLVLAPGLQIEDELPFLRDLHLLQIKTREIRT